MPAEDWNYDITEGMRENVLALDRAGGASGTLPDLESSLPGTLMASQAAYRSISGGMQRGLSSAVALGLLADDNNDVMQGLYKTLAATNAAFAAYSVIRGLVMAKAAIEASMAAAEVTLHTLALDFAGIAVAAGAAGAAYGLTQYATGEWTFPQPDLSSHAGRTQAANTVSRVATGG